MECPECRGEGRILLFVSNRECERCAGTGQVASEAASTVSTDPPGGSLQSAYDGGKQLNLTGLAGSTGGVISTGAGSGGAFTITGGDSVSSGASVTIKAGYSNGASPDTPITITGGGGTITLQESVMTDVTPQILTGSEAPPEAPVGSMYLSTQGDVMLKTKEDGWLPLATGGGGGCDCHASSGCQTDAEINAALNDVLEARVDKNRIVQLVAEKARTYGALEAAVRSEEITADEKMDRVSRLVLSTIPAVAPVSLSIVADMMAIIEQEGIEVIAFASSARDFADIRKFANGPGVKWEGKQCSYFGVPFFQSPEIPAGFVAAVAADDRLVLCPVLR